MSEIRVNSLGNETNTGGPELSGITEFSGQKYFIPPKGTTSERPSGCPPGSIRFNTDSAHLEYWNGLVWLEFEASSEELGDQNNTNSSRGTGHRALTMGGQNAGNNRVDIIEYLSIPNFGNAQDFGNLQDTKRNNGALGSRTRGYSAGGTKPGTTFAAIDTVVFASTGNATDYGDLQNARELITGASNSTRGLFVGAYPSSDIMDLISLDSTGSGVDFGNLTVGRQDLAGLASCVRALFAGGNTAPATDDVNIIDYVTISSQGNAQDFGDLLEPINAVKGCASSTRGIVAGGQTPTFRDTIQYVTISSTGNAIDFGNLVIAKMSGGLASSATRAVYIAGQNSSGDALDTIDAFEIASTGNAVDFGDIADGSRDFNAACSNGHGGL